MYDQLNGSSKHDIVVVGRRVREREKQRLEARCCPTCGLPIEYIHKLYQWIVLSCGHEFVKGNYYGCGSPYSVFQTDLHTIYEERNVNGIRQNQRSVTNEEVNSDGYNNIG